MQFSKNFKGGATIAMALLLVISATMPGCNDDKKEEPAPAGDSLKTRQIDNVAPKENTKDTLHDSTREHSQMPARN